LCGIPKLAGGLRFATRGDGEDFSRIGNDTLLVTGS
jgi:hypothetical protein